MIVEHFILSKGSSIDSERNSLSIFDMIEDTTASYTNDQPPTDAVMECMITIVFLRESEKGAFKRNVTLKYTQPDGKANEIKVVADFAAPIKRYRVRMIAPFFIGKSGDHKFSLLPEKSNTPMSSRSLTVSWTKASK
jgi:hypothetical protein